MINSLLRLFAHVTPLDHIDLPAVKVINCENLSQGRSPWKRNNFLLVMKDEWGLVGFTVSAYYHLLIGHSEQSFPWKSIWKQKIPSRVAFFVWTAALRKCLTIDNLRKRKVCILDWCYMCKCNSESVNHLFLHCPVASELWDMVFGLFGVNWVMPLSVVGLFAC